MLGTCPMCHQDSTQKSSAIYSGGTANTSGSVTVNGTGGTSSTAGYGGTTQTDIARRCSPPRNKPSAFDLMVMYYFVGLMGIPLIGIVLFIALIILGAIFKDPWPQISAALYAGIAAIYNLVPVSNPWGKFFLLPLVPAVLSIPFGIKNQIWNQTEFCALEQKWQRTWYCHRCDQFFEV